MKNIVSRITTLLLLIAGVSFCSCELDGPLAIYKIVVNENPLMIPGEIISNIDSCNVEFTQKPCEKDYALAKYKSICYDLQKYYDEHRGKLIWNSFCFDVCLHNMSSHEGGPEGLLIDTKTITYYAE